MGKTSFKHILKQDGEMVNNGAARSDNIPFHVVSGALLVEGDTTFVEDKVASLKVAIYAVIYAV